MLESRTNLQINATLAGLEDTNADVQSGRTGEFCFEKRNFSLVSMSDHRLTSLASNPKSLKHYLLTKAHLLDDL